MSKFLRLFVAIAMLLGLVVLARHEGARLDRSARAQAEASVSANGDDDCDRGKDKNKHHCEDKDKDKEKKKCKKKDDDCGTVQPPDDEIEVCERGTYSVGGIAVLDIKNLRHEHCLEAHTRDADPALDQIPGGGEILAGVIVVDLAPKSGKVNICFAVPPGETVTIYASHDGSYQPLKTKIKNGVACADVAGSGNYTLVGQ